MALFDEKETIYASSVIDFITVSAEYCVTLEKNEPIEKLDFVSKITKLLPLIYVKASTLPNIEEEDFELQDYVTEEDYNFVQNRVWSILKEDDEYLEVFAPDFQYSEAPITATISENLADIYQDIKNFVCQFRTGINQTMNDAVVECRENFAGQWGQTLVNVLRALHEVKYMPHDDDDELNGD